MTQAQAFRTPDPASALGGLLLEGARLLLVSGDDLLSRRLAQATRRAGGSMTTVCATDEALALLRVGYRPGVLLIDSQLTASDRRALEGAVLESAHRGTVTMVTVVTASC